MDVRSEPFANSSKTVNLGKRVIILVSMPCVLRPSRNFFRQGGICQRRSIRVDQAFFSDQSRLSLMSELASMMSFRMMAVIATLAGFPANMSVRYFAPSC